MNVFVDFLLAAVVLVLAVKDDAVLRQWSEFKSTYGKRYKSSVEAKRRLAIFRENLNGIEQHNTRYEQGITTYKKGVNQFADWTKDEFLQYVNRGLVNKPTVTGTTFNEHKKFVAPNHVDWRTKNVVTKVKSQGLCGSGWTFSTTGSLEGQLGINGTLVSLSEQNLMDCSRRHGNNACKGGFVDVAFDYIKSKGIASEEDYPYEGKSNFCRDKNSKKVTKVSGVVRIIEGSESALQEAVANKGPISVSINVTDNLQFYSSGIFNDPSCSRHYLGHAVLLVGYGIKSGKEYYIVKNSWGALWGENGYVRMTKNNNNQCGIANAGLYPIL